MSLDALCVVEIHTYQPNSATAGENSAWFVHDSLPVGSADVTFDGVPFKSTTARRRLNGVIAFVRQYITETPVCADKPGVLQSILGVDPPALTAGWNCFTTTVLLASTRDTAAATEQSSKSRDALLTALCTALSTAKAEGDTQWDTVPPNTGVPDATIKKDAYGKMIVVLCDDAQDIPTYLEALSELPFLHAESQWHTARRARDRCANLHGQLTSGVAELAKLSRGAYASVNQVVEKVRREHRIMERSRDNIQTEQGQLNHGCLRGVVEIRIRDVTIAMQDAEDNLADAGRGLENAKWALAQKQWEASDYLNRMLMVVQVILIIAAIWPTAFAAYVDKKTGGSEHWLNTWTTFGYMLTVGIALSLLALVIVFTTKAIFGRLWSKS